MSGLSTFISTFTVVNWADPIEEDNENIVYKVCVSTSKKEKVISTLDGSEHEVERGHNFALYSFSNLVDAEKKMEEVLVDPFKHLNERQKVMLCDINSLREDSFTIIRVCKEE